MILLMVALCLMLQQGDHDVDTKKELSEMNKQELLLKNELLNSFSQMSKCFLMLVSKPFSKESDMHPHSNVAFMLFVS